METFLLNLAKTSLLGALAVAAMLACKPLWRERYRAKTRCWLWLFLSLFLLLPVDYSVKNAPVQAAPPTDYTLFVGSEKTTVIATDNLFGDMAEQSGQSPAAVRDAINDRPVTNPEQRTTRYIPVTTILFYGYLAGAAAFLLYQGVSYALFRRAVRRWRREVSRADYAFLLCDTARELHIDPPRMLICEAVTTPAVTGFFRPALLLPSERYDLTELRYILRHELCHLKRRDMLLKLVLLAANAMHWFNPVVYLMLRQADEDIELACDSAATDGLERAERAAYSRTLLAAVQSNVRALPATTCFGSTVERLKRRITNVLGAQKKRGLGIVALVLALTLAAGCAVGWDRGAQAADDPFSGSLYSVELVAEDTSLTAGSEYYVLTSAGYTIKLSKNPGPYLWFNFLDGVSHGYLMAKASQSTITRSSELTEENFDDAWSGPADVDMSALRSDNKAVWCRDNGASFNLELPDSTTEPYLIYLLQQNDGSLYLCLGYSFQRDGNNIRQFRWIFRLTAASDPTQVFATMDDYAAARVAQARAAGTITYYTDGSDGSSPITDHVSDMRVRELSLLSTYLDNDLCPDGILELWLFSAEEKPLNPDGLEITPVGGQSLSDDGYLFDGVPEYLTVLHNGDGYHVLLSQPSNDGLGGYYNDEPKAYLHDVYADYAQLDVPRYQVASLYRFTDGYGNDLTPDGRIQSGGGWYFYLPYTGTWSAKLDEPLWESAYGTRSTFVVKDFSTAVSDAERYFERDGWDVEQVNGRSVYAKTDGEQHARIRLFDRPDGGHYEVQTFWYDGQSTQENQWGWSAARQVEGERSLLEQMANTFTVSDAMKKAYSPSFPADVALVSSGGGIDSIVYYASANSSDHRSVSLVDGESALHLSDFTYKKLPDTTRVPEGRYVQLWPENSNQSYFEFYEGSNIVRYVLTKDGSVCYEASGDFGKHETIFDAMLAWFEEAAANEDAESANAVIKNTVLNRDVLIQSSGSHVDFGGFLWYTADGELRRYRSGVIETVDTLPIDYLNDTPVNASLSTQDDRLLMSYHIGGATMGSFVTDLYGVDGKKIASIDGYNSIAISGDTVVKTLQFPPAANNLYISYDCGGTFTPLGDKDWYYGAVKEDDSGVTYMSAELEIRDGYVYTHAVYDVFHDKTSDPLVTHEVRLNLKTGAQEILD